MGRRESDLSVVRVPAYSYIHVIDNNTNVTRLETGPQTFVAKDNEKIVLDPTPFVTIPERSFATIKNPVERDEKGEVKYDDYGGAKLHFADTEIRFHDFLSGERFPLYPGEVLEGEVKELRVVAKDTALRIHCTQDFKDKAGTQRVAGEEWLFFGPATYYPRKEEKAVSVIKSLIIGRNQAVRLRATRDLEDANKKKRVAGEEWLIRKVGNYLPGPHEMVIETLDSRVLTDKKALHVRATGNFTDFTGKERKTGDTWLVTKDDIEAFIPDICEEVVQEVAVTTLSSRQYCVIEDPVDANLKNQRGKKILRRGEASFFLHPEESIPRGIQNFIILGEDEGLVLTANEAFTDENNISRAPGDKWMFKGPGEFVPTVETDIKCLNKAIALAETEGVYIRDIKTGRVRTEIGTTYLLKENEEFWEKELPEHVTKLIGLDPLVNRNNRIDISNDVIRQRDNMHKRAAPGGSLFGATNAEFVGAPVGRKGFPTTVVPKAARVVSLEVPQNAACQLYDFKAKKSRVVFGPELVMLQPDEQFTVLSLSGDKPKKPGVIKSLVLLLGPDFCTDVVDVETVDHARLRLNVSYNWNFDTDKAKASDEAKEKLFCVPDFIGDMCKTTASRIRAAVASKTFDEFHKDSAKIIRGSVLGFEDTEKTKVKDKLEFPNNHLVITSVDIQCVEPVDQRTKDSLMKSVQLAIEITTNSQEAKAKQDALRVEQKAKGELERQRIQDDAEAEKSRQELLKLQAASAALESCGQAQAEAKSRAEASAIEFQASVDQARLRAEAQKIEADAELDRLQKARDAEIDYIKKKNELELTKQQEESKLEIAKFKEMVDAIGPDTIRAMASAGQDNQVKLLQSLGLTSTLITDGRSPINLLNTAQGFISAAGGSANSMPAAQPRIQPEDL
ncbi:Oidioi.mRNA.OKI2018_I69.XSR.g15943.t1.cds [Oikopleura dioica]|uniref:Major vault protein n=1 Tax=Oikopleura dioica TaxID=34765 RepID=A0ABN7SIH0_OIKDI|nr:Oidioi.mRNA.OKI2018_I69.XSR.g15943.t1.cds [Oikopleura dioica]